MQRVYLELWDYICMDFWNAEHLRLNKQSSEASTFNYLMTAFFLFFNHKRTKTCNISKYVNEWLLLLNKSDRDQEFQLHREI